MKKYFWLKLFSSLLAITFGFMQKVAAQYGVIQTAYSFKGNVLDVQTCQPIPNAAVRFKTNYNEQIVNTDSNGKFNIRMYQGYTKPLEIKVRDIDEKINGEYLDKDTCFFLSEKDFVFDDNNSHWHLNAFYNHEFVLLLHPAITRDEVFLDTVIPEVPLTIIDSTDNPIIPDTFSVTSNTSILKPDLDKPLEASVFPNPTESNLTIAFRHPASGKIILKIYSIQLELIYEKAEVLSQYSTRIYLNISQFANGNYFLIVEAEGKKFTHKITKM